MHPEAFALGGMVIRWYGVMMALGFIAATLVAQWRCGKAGATPDEVGNLMLVAMVSGVIGSRIWYVVQFWEQFRGNLLEIVRIDHGGQVFYGGFICAVAALVWYCRRRKLDLLKVFDLLTPSLALGHAFGRVGCFLNGCCFGSPTDMPWGVRFPAGSPPTLTFPGEALHPVQLYESIGNFAIFALLSWRLGKMRPGQITLAYLACYSALRFVDEFFRGDHQHRLLGGLTAAQTLSIIIIIVAIVAGLALERRKTKE